MSNYGRRWRKLREQVLERDGWECWRCGAQADTVDHVLPLALGGTHDLDNLAACCARCNYSAGARLRAELRRDPFLR